MLLRATVATCLAVTLLAAVAGTAVGKETMTVEVAEIGSRFIPDLAEGGTVPRRGTTFVTEGYIYPEGTLTCADGVCNGVVYDAAGNPSPEFPDEVIGTWTCYGSFTEDAETASTGPLLLSTQMYDMGESPGADTILSSGWELADIGVPVSRAITGGTGDHAGATGVQTQTLLGFNNTETIVGDAPAFGVGLHVELTSLG
jgi:hypothetical protein